MCDRALVAALALILVSCDTPALDLIPPRASTQTSTIVEPPSSVEPVLDDPPMWEGFAAVHGSTQGLAAYALGDLPVYESPGTGDPFTVLDRMTILGTVTVLGVVNPPRNDWVEVMLPVRPNGSTGWVRTSDVSFYVADGEIVVDLTARRLTYIVDGIEVLSSAVGVGSPHNPTPTGEFFVTDSVTMADPNSPWGPHALGLSARSDAITSFNGGDGIIGIHGTNNPSSIGDDISLGCVRLPNEMITLLHGMVPVGTRVEIRA